MNKLYYYTVVYRVFDTKNGVVMAKQESVQSLYFYDFDFCREEAINVMRCPVSSIIEDKLLRGFRNKKILRAFASGYSVHSIMVDDVTYSRLLDNKAVKGIIF